MRHPLFAIAAGLVALGQDAETASSAIAPCEWCGRHHDRLALCPPRPLARGISRRSFLQLGAAAVVGAMLPAPPLEWMVRPVEYVGEPFNPALADSLFKEIYAEPIAALLRPSKINLLSAHMLGEEAQQPVTLEQATRVSVAGRRELPERTMRHWLREVGGGEE